MATFARIAVPAPLMPLDTLFDYAVPENLEVEAGSLVEVPLGRRKSWGVVFGLAQQTEVPREKIREVLSLKLPLPVFDKVRLQFLSWLSRYYFFPLGEVCESALPGPVRDGTARTLKLPEALPAGAFFSGEGPRLNSEQAAALKTINELERGTHLLWGVTGSGKTEVYLQAIAERHRRGQGALVLVPEIALTPQLTRRFEERFPGQVAIFHSALKPTEIRRAWLEVLSGLKNIAIGARSALFAPVQNLGLIILDEEHDSSYKQEERLRYHARDAAQALAALYKIPVLLGSATPSAETLFEVESGKATVSELPHRAVGEARLPEIEVVDLKKSLPQQNKDPAESKLEPDLNFKIRGDFFLSPELRSGLEEVLEKKQQAILFLNRRGLGSQEFCRHCGHSADCPNCDVKLTPHHRGLLCHYCGFETEKLHTCPECGRGNDPFLRVGVGTEAIEEALAFHFPRARLLRLDRDTVSSAGAMDEIVESFRNEEADILIGTQMVAKGHDFPQVTLVGILLAELGLSVPDFRAFERNLQLLLQVSGRAGRALHPGRVILQSFQPDHPVFQSLKSQRGLADYRDFLLTEIERRKLLHYPPHARAVLLRFDGLEASKVSSAAAEVGNALRKIESQQLQVLGPVSAPIAKIRSRFRFQILLKGQSAHAIHKSVGWILDGWDKQKLESRFKTRLTVDVDPVGML